MNKYFAKKYEVNGIVFHSIKEGKYYEKLLNLRSAKDKKERVVKIELQVPFKIYINGIKVFAYYLDFKVWYANNVIRYQDVKGYKKGAAYSMFKLKKKCVEAQEGIVIEEV